MSEQCGTPAYIAPEILKDKGYDGFKVDVWSAGVCLYAMLIGTVPFKASTMQELHLLIINGKYDINNPNANQQSKEGTQQTAQPQQPQTKLSEHAVNLIHSLLQVDPRKRLSAVEVLSHPWLKDAKDEMDIFTQKEKDVIHKEYLAKNIDRTQQPRKDFNDTNLLHQDTEVIFTEHNLDTKTNVSALLKNASTKSIILAPFNSTVSDLPEQWPEEVKRMIVPKRVLKFAPKVKDLDRQYEHNNNADLDNGVYNNVGNEDDPAN
jgi:serine/threonine protein kinase